MSQRVVVAIDENGSHVLRVLGNLDDDEVQFMNDWLRDKESSSPDPYRFKVHNLTQGSTAIYNILYGDRGAKVCAE